jgi:hypothetical protein
MNVQFYKPNAKGTGTACSFWRDERDNSFWASMIRQDSATAKTFGKNKDNPKKNVKTKFQAVEVAGIIDAIERNAEYKGYHKSRNQEISFFFKPYFKGEETEELGEVAGDVEVSNKKSKLNGNLNGKISKTKPTQVGFSFSINRTDIEDTTDKQSYLIGFYYPEATLLKNYLQTILQDSFRVPFNKGSSEKKPTQSKNTKDEYDF